LRGKSGGAGRGAEQIYYPLLSSVLSGLLILLLVDM